MNRAFMVAGGVSGGVFLVNFAVLWFVDAHIISFWSLGILTGLLLVAGVVVPSRREGSR